mmetsp:Transcript_15092/g.17282  ORF Transcript_15092/g.17282 Transcript_15092/m.17282 type:complete len:112 (-) Transcript_15092:1859-2194(-)
MNRNSVILLEMFNATDSNGLVIELRPCGRSSFLQPLLVCLWKDGSTYDSLQMSMILPLPDEEVYPEHQKFPYNEVCSNYRNKRCPFWDARLPERLSANVLFGYCAEYYESV